MDEPCLFSTFVLMPIRVAVFEDTAIYLEYLSTILGAEPEIILTGAFPDCSELPLKMETARPEVVIMDIEMPGINGIEGLRQIKRIAPSTRVIMQTSHDEDEFVFKAICAGASGYLLKNRGPEEIVRSVQEVSDGGAPMSPTIASKVLTLLQHHAPHGSEEPVEYGLSKREKEVLSCLVKGMSFKMIADTCFISYETVRSHMKKIYEKLHVASNTEAVAKALKQGLV